MNLSKQQYRAVDLTIFAVLITVFEVINIFATNNWFPDETYTLSLLIPLVAIVIMRWGAFGIIHSALSGLAYCIAMDVSGVSVLWQQYVIYVVGSCFVGLILIFNKFVGKERIASKVTWSMLYVLLIYLSLEIGRTLVAVCLGQSILVFVNFAMSDTLSAAIAVVIVLIARKQNGLFEDQMHYLRRLETEREEERKIKDAGLK